MAGEESADGRVGSASLSLADLCHELLAQTPD